MSGTPKPSGVPFKAAFFKGTTIAVEWVAFFRDIISKKPQYDEVHLISTGVIYLGDSATDGSWRVQRSGNDVIWERREAGSWVTKSTISA
jgi:hypothetical protein